MTPAQRQANYRKRQEEKLRRYEAALHVIATEPPNHPWALMAYDVARNALNPVLPDRAKRI